jgi:geranylgeranyl diphosphate synthase type II
VILDALAIQTFGKQVMVILLRIKKPIYFKSKRIFLDGQKKNYHLFSIHPDNTEKIALVKSIFNETGASEAKSAIEEYTFKAFETLNKMDIVEDKKKYFCNFMENN